MDLNMNNNSFSFTWKAFFSDSSILEQFENGIENKFQLVKDKFDKLIRFSLVNKDYSQCFTVDLQNGLIIYNNYKNIEDNKKENCRLIFFRRHRVEFGSNLQELGHNIIYFLGFQYNTEDKQNKKIILQIDSVGNFIIGD